MQPYIPDTLPLKNLDWIKFIPLIGSANAELARYDGILQGIINPAILLSPLTTQEAVVSSKIEGTQATLEEVLEFEALPSEDNQKFKDIQEILNYRKAMKFAENWLLEKPISLNMIKETHSILLDSVRGRNKGRGKFRKLQNWIGSPGCNMENASYVPPAPSRLMEFLSNLEQYIHYNEKDSLVQLAIIHGQFEVIHPFVDGNGRVGRILIPLFLYEKKLLNAPMFYISAYMERKRNQYYSGLRGITENHDWESWIEFFLTAIVEQAKSNSRKAKDIIDLYEKMKLQITNITRSKYAINVLDALFEKPIFSTQEFIRISKVKKRTALRLLNTLEEHDILHTITESKGRQPGVMAFSELLQIIER